LIRVFVGCAASGEDAESLAVLEYTLRKNASEPVQIEFMAQSHDPASFWHGWNSERWATPFSAFRWGIPAFCKYEGRAVYTDSDVIFLGDIAELWHQPIPEGKIALAKGGGSWRLCVSLWDCEAAVLRIPPLHELKTDPQSHSKVNRAVKPYIAPFDGEWNCLDGHGFSDLSDPRLKALHYTDMSTQPHLRHALPRLNAAGQKHWFPEANVRPHARKDIEALFDRLLAEANDAGFRVENYIPPEPFGDYKKKSLTNYRRRAA
jgi:hypothetical protein